MKRRRREPEVAQVVVVGEHHRLVTGPAGLVEVRDVGQEVDDLLLEALAAEERLVVEGARSSHDVEDAACQVVAEVRVGGRQLGDALPQLVVVGGLGEPIVGDAQPAAILERGLDESCVARCLEQGAEREIPRVARLGLLGPLAVLRDRGARVGGHRSCRLHRVKRGPAGLVDADWDAARAQTGVERAAKVQTSVEGVEVGELEGRVLTVVRERDDAPWHLDLSQKLGHQHVGRRRASHEADLAELVELTPRAVDDATRGAEAEGLGDERHRALLVVVGAGAAERAAAPAEVGVLRNAALGALACGAVLLDVRGVGRHGVGVPRLGEDVDRVLLVLGGLELAGLEACAARAAETRGDEVLLAAGGTEDDGIGGHVLEPLGVAVAARRLAALGEVWRRGGDRARA